MKGINCFFGILLSFLACNFFVSAEVEQVTVKWTPGLCITNCPQSLEKEFKKIKGVATISINQGSGQADLTWKPNEPFTYQLVSTAMRMIGLTIHDFRVRVKGTIRHDDHNVILVSIGDNTRFVLLGPITPSLHNQVIEHNVQNHPLAAGKRDQLLNAEMNNQIVTIEGPIFEGWKAPPLYLIAEQVQVQQNPPEQKR